MPSKKYSIRVLSFHRRQGIFYTQILYIIFFPTISLRTCLQTLERQKSLVIPDLDSDLRLYCSI